MALFAESFIRNGEAIATACDRISLLGSTPSTCLRVPALKCSLTCPSVADNDELEVVEEVGGRGGSLLPQQAHTAKVACEAIGNWLAAQIHEHQTRKL